MQVHFLPWLPDAEVFGEAAGFSFGHRLIDLVVTIGADGNFYWEIVEDLDALGSGQTTTMKAAKQAAETAARRKMLS